jgi:hypothetical protein
MHATKHFVNTGHPVIIPFPDKDWKWCYIDKLYGYSRNVVPGHLNGILGTTVEEVVASAFDFVPAVL